MFTFLYTNILPQRHQPLITYIEYTFKCYFANTVGNFNNWVSKQLNDFLLGNFYCHNNTALPSKYNLAIRLTANTKRPLQELRN